MTFVKCLNPVFLHCAFVRLISLIEPEALADFLRRGSASASGSIRETERGIRFLVLAISLLSLESAAVGQSPAIAPYRMARVTLAMRATSECPSNFLLLSDVAELKGSDALVQQLTDLVMDVAPALGKKQIWTREAVERILVQRGVSREAVTWNGANECSVLRIDGQRAKKQDVPPSKNTLTPDGVQLASAPPLPSGRAMPLGEKPIDQLAFIPTSVTPMTIKAAERNAADLISRYLQTKTNSNGQWVVKPMVPPEHAKTLSVSQQIKSVAGGQPPWEGEQEFVFLAKGANGETPITIQANIKLPDMVVAANRPLAKGYVLKESDLVWIPIPRGLTYGPEDCFAAPDALVGQQLRRSMSTQQVIRQTEVGPPTVVQTGDLITIEVVSGAVSVATNGRAIEAGSIDDLIQVEIEPNRTRLLARVTGPKSVEVIANTGRISQSKSNRTTNNLIRR
ncbi:MAG: flagellar basal body P-ring formation chaperone FlgA [Pirellula sp.]